MMLVALLLILGQTDGEPLSTGDLAAYRRALKPAERPSESVGFLDLWEHPEAHRGQFVRVSGRFARRFRQPASGGFPALTELWLSTPAGNLVCVVFPTAGGEIRPSGDMLEFEGTFLRLIRYPSGDVPRLAPLIVGPEAPRVVVEERAEAGSTWGYWVSSGIVVAVAGLVFAYLHMRGGGGGRR